MTNYNSPIILPYHQLYDIYYPPEEWETEREEFIRKNKRPFIHKKESEKFERRIAKKHNPRSRRSLCLYCRRGEVKWRSKRVWKRDNLFNEKAGGTYTKIAKLKARRTYQQYLHFQRKTDNHFSPEAITKQQLLRRQPIWSWD